MRDLSNTSIKVASYKCFGQEAQGLESIKPINLIIGRNNSGKSAVLDLVSFFVRAKFDTPQLLWHQNNMRPRFIITTEPTEYELQQVFRPNTRSGNLPAGNDWAYGTRFLGCRLTWDVETNEFIALDGDPEPEHQPVPKKAHREWLSKMAKGQGNHIVIAKHRVRNAHSSRTAIVCAIATLLHSISDELR